MIKIELDKGKSTVEIKDDDVNWVITDLIVGIPTSINAILNKICVSAIQKNDIVRSLMEQMKDEELIEGYDL